MNKLVVEIQYIIETDWSEAEIQEANRAKFFLGELLKRIATGGEYSITIFRRDGKVIC